MINVGYEENVIVAKLNHELNIVNQIGSWVNRHMPTF